MVASTLEQPPIRVAPRGFHSTPQISVIVPALNEAGNLPELLRRVDAGLAGRRYEVLVIDDGSRDGTDDVCADLARRYPLSLHVRTEPDGGLSGAVLFGMNLARGEVLVVMDADLQHPPEELPNLIERLEGGGAEFVIGSRHADGGSTAERWGAFRRINSKVATALARPFAGDTLDPMSGYFALRRQTYQRAKRLTPLGYKVGLELMCKCRVERVAEVPIHFSTRNHGRSKLTVAQQFKYLEHLSRLYDFCYPRLSPVVKFLVVIGYGWFVALGLFGLMILAGLKPFVAAPIAYAATVFTTAVFHIRYVRAQRRFLVTRRPWRDFAVVSAAEWAACALTAFWMAGRLRETNNLEVFLVTFGVATATRYVLRKEFMLDIRGLRRAFRADDLD